MNVTTSETDAYVAGEVRAELARQRLTIREVAARLGVTHTWLHRRLIAVTPFGAGELAALADMLGVPVDRFYRGRKRMSKLRPRLFHNNSVITSLSFS